MNNQNKTSNDDFFLQQLRLIGSIQELHQAVLDNIVEKLKNSIPPKNMLTVVKLYSDNNKAIFQNMQRIKKLLANNNIETNNENQTQYYIPYFEIDKQNTINVIQPTKNNYELFFTIHAQDDKFMHVAGCRDKNTKNDTIFFSLNNFENKQDDKNYDLEIYSDLTKKYWSQKITFENQNIENALKINNK